jgi:hypothetical protein
MKDSLRCRKLICGFIIVRRFYLSQAVLLKSGGEKMYIINIYYIDVIVLMACSYLLTYLYIYYGDVLEFYPLRLLVRRLTF